MAVPDLLSRPAPSNPAAEHAVRFIKALTHSAGEWAGKPFQLHPWQEAVLRHLFGTLTPDGRRQYRRCYIEIPRKNGKTELAAAIALYMLLGDGERGGQVYGAAVDRDQATLVYTAARRMVEQDAGLRSRVEIIPSTRRIYHPASGSIYRAIPGDAPSAHGFNASAVIYDELHAAPNRELWDVLTTATGTRRQPLTLVITTAGYDRSSICWEQHDYAEKVRDGVLEDPSFLPVIYAAPPEADWRDEAVWREANPALGTFRSLEEMQATAREAAQVPARQNAFRRLYLNQWTESMTRWLDPDAWEACTGPSPWPELPAALAGRRVWIGLDLSSKLDLTAAVLVAPDGQGGFDVVPHFWLPEADLRTRVQRDRVPYDTWAAQGAVTLTPGNRVDYAFVRDWILKAVSTYDVAEIDVDPWNAGPLVTQLQQDGCLCVEVRQGYASLSTPTKELEALVVARRLRHGGHPVLRWCAHNVMVASDPAGNLKPVKEKNSPQRIDGIVALVTALSRLLRDPVEGLSAQLEARGLLVIGA